MRQAGLVKSAGTTLTRFKNYDRFDQLPSDFYCNADLEGAPERKWREFSPEQAVSLRVMVDLMQDSFVSIYPAQEISSEIMSAAWEARGQKLDALVDESKLDLWGLCKVHFFELPADHELDEKSLWEVSGRWNLAQEWGDGRLRARLSLYDVGAFYSAVVQAGDQEEKLRSAVPAASWISSRMICVNISAAARYVLNALGSAE